MNTINYISEAKGNKEKILAFVRANPGCGTNALRREFGFTASHCSMYLHRLMHLGLIETDSEPHARDRTWKAVDLEKVDLFPARRVVRTSWQPEARRDYMVEALFGPAILVNGTPATSNDPFSTAA